MRESPASLCLLIHYMMDACLKKRCFILKCMILLRMKSGLPGGSAGKESVCDAGDPGSILGQEEPPGEVIVYPL